MVYTQCSFINKKSLILFIRSVMIGPISEMGSYEQLFIAFFLKYTTRKRIQTNSYR